jgi:transposase-like protein
MNKGKVWCHPEAFQRMAVERFKCCENIDHLANELGVARQTLYRWHRKSECAEQCAEEGEDPVLAKSRESRFRREIRDLKRLLAEKVLEVDFFKGALQQIESRHREHSGFGRPTFTSTSGA